MKLMYLIIPMTLAAVLLREEYVECAKHKHCPEVCGEVLIEYPFFIGPNCSSGNDYFEIACDKSYLDHKPRPILTKLNLELIELENYSDLFGLMTVKMPVAKVCADNELQWRSVNLSGSPFRFDLVKNVFVSVGCHGKASLYDNADQLMGQCSSTCDPPGQVIDRCNGYYCCQFDINSTGLDNQYAVRVSSNASAGDEKTSCRSAFLTSRTSLLTNSTLSIAINNKSSVSVLLYFSVPNPSTHYDATIEMVRKVSMYIIAPVFGTALVCSCCFLSFWLWKTRRERKEIKLRAKYFMRRLEERSNNKEVVEKTNLFTIRELKKATNNFDEDCILGQGGQGTFYKGMLTNGQVIAVKKAKYFEENNWEQLINEVILLSQVSHKNIVKLLGCCLETKIPLLIYEFVPNGTLSQCIHNPFNEISLTWEMRLRIASEAASAIAYLHSSSSTPIFHRDIKTTNILLDNGYQAKVADFGISRAVCIDQTHCTTGIQGTFGYLDPEYFESSQFSEKSDVYSFGVILVELLTGQEPIRPSRLEEERSLVEFFISTMDRLHLDDILDPMVLDESNKETIVSVAILAKQCLRERGTERPTMKEVAIELEGLVKKVTMPPRLDQVSMEIEEIASQPCIETHNYIFTSPAIYEGFNVEGISNEEKPLFFMSH